MSVHQFDTDIAKEYGIEAAIILQNLNYWIEKNIANEKHFHDGMYWTYNSIKAFNELFPYISESTIRRTLKSLEDSGIIKTGNYNKAGYDRTMWYAITEKGFCILNKSILSNRQMEIVKSSNGFSQSDEPIPDIKPDGNTNDKHKEDTPDKPAIPSKPKQTRKKQEFVIPTIEELTNYVIEKQLVINPYKFKEWYDRTEWKDNTGKPIQNWKMKLLNWDSREKDKNPSSVPYSKPIQKTEYRPVEKNCPKCGGIINFGMCSSCGILIGTDGKEVIL